MRRVRIASVRISARHAEMLRAAAEAHRLPVARMAALKLEQALEDEQDGVATSLFLPAVEAAIRREVARAANRLAHLLARSAVEASTTRRLLHHHLQRDERWTEEEVARLHNELWYRSVERLKQPLTEIAEILHAAGFPPAGREDRTS